MAIEPKQINVVVDLTRPGTVNTQKELRYGDKNLLTVEVTEGGSPIDLTTIGAVTTDLVVKRLGSTNKDVVGSIVDGKAQFTVDGDSLAVPGYTEAVVQFYDAAGDRISTATFSFKTLADPSLTAVGDVVEQTIIQQVLVDGPQVIADAEDKLALMDEAVTSTRVEYKGVLANDAALSALTGMQVGDWYRITSSASNGGLSRSVRYDGTQWVTTDLEDPNVISTVTAQLADKASKQDVASISSGTPLFAENVAGMTDTTRAYVNKMDGFIYLYNSGTSIFENSNIKYQSEVLSLYDVDTDENPLYDFKKENDIIKLEVKYGALTLDSIAYENLTYAQLFGDKNLISNSHFDNDLTGFTVNAGTPTISTEVFNTSSKSLRAFGTSSQQVRVNPTLVANGSYFVAVKAKLERYASGGGLGYQFVQTSDQALKTLTSPTADFVTLSAIHVFTGTSPILYVGTLQTANVDGYIDDVVLINLNDFSVIPDVQTMKTLYENYLKLVKGEEVISEVKVFSLSSSEAPLDPISESLAKSTFITEMNNKAEQIGMTGTNYVTPDGTPSAQHITTAKDLVKLGIQATGYDELVKVWNKKTYTVNVEGVNPRQINITTTVTGVELENSYYIFGGKTGSWAGAPYITQNLLVVANAPNERWFVGAVIEANEDRFKVAKEMFDIATLYLDEGYSGVHDVNANKVAASLVPIHNPFGYEQAEIPVLWGKSEEVTGYPASITKVMTAMLLLDYVKDINQKFTFKSSDVTSGSGPSLGDGDIITFKDALYLLMLPSSNTTATAIARVVGEKIVRSQQA